MAPVEPAPLTWTLRLKIHKCTVLLVADPLAPLGHVKTELLRALQARYPAGTIPTASGPARIPSSENDILLAKPVDIHNVDKGWWRMVIVGEENDANDEDDGGMDGASDAKAKGRKKSTTTTNGDASAFETPKHAGLKDGSVLAIRFKSHTSAKERDEGLGFDVEEEGMGWDVVIPSYEDFTGTANTGDVGGG